jgi:hypothetical protein
MPTLQELITAALQAKNVGSVKADPGQRALDAYTYATEPFDFMKRTRDYGSLNPVMDLLTPGRADVGTGVVRKLGINAATALMAGTVKDAILGTGVQRMAAPRKMSANALENMRRRYAGDFYDKVKEMGQTAADTLRAEWPGPYNMHPDEILELKKSPDWKQVSQETRNLLNALGQANWFEADTPYGGAKAAFDLGHIQPDAPLEAIQRAVLETYPKNLRRAMSRYMTKALGK